MVGGLEKTGKKAEATLYLAMPLWYFYGVELCAKVRRQEGEVVRVLAGCQFPCLRLLSQLISIEIHHFNETNVEEENGKKTILTSNFSDGDGGNHRRDGIRSAGLLGQSSKDNPGEKWICIS
jgi:hypothetical protein